MTQRKKFWFGILVHGSLIHFALFFLSWVGLVGMRMVSSIGDSNRFHPEFAFGYFAIMMGVMLVGTLLTYSGAITGTVLNWTHNPDRQAIKILWTVGFYLAPAITGPLFYWMRLRRIPPTDLYPTPGVTVFARA